ncbi:hypothetical protein ACVFI8_18830 [Agarivorans sp. MS3-6]|nr:hypothetical protein [Agarivorans sp. TSD2052]
MNQPIRNKVAILFIWPQILGGDRAVNKVIGDIKRCFEMIIVQFG